MKRCKYCGGELIQKEELEEIWINETFATHQTVYEPHYVWEHKDDIAAYNANCPRFYKECRRIPWDRGMHETPRWELNKIYDTETGEWSDWEEDD